MWELFDTLIRDEKKFSVLEMVARAIDRLPPTELAKMKPRLIAIADTAGKRASGDHHIHETLASIFIFRFLRTGDPDFEKRVDQIISSCQTQEGVRGLQTQLHGCRAGGWMTAGDAVNPDPEADAVRLRTWDFLSKVLSTAQRKLKALREEWKRLHQSGEPNKVLIAAVEESIRGLVSLVDAVGMQIYFACGAFKQKEKEDKELTPAQLKRFWSEAAPLLRDLASEIHPHVAYHLVQTFEHLLPFAPEDIFLLAAKAIQKSSEAGFQNESLAVSEVVRLIQRVLADHREIFRKNGPNESECLTALIRVLDLFVEAGWPEARQLTHRLEEIYR